jgi:hypothetical protein
MARVILLLAVSFSMLLIHTPGYSAKDDPMDFEGKSDKPSKTGSDVPFKGCIYYEYAHFTGKPREIRFGQQLNYVGNQWNDTISSIECSAGCKLQVWVHRDFKGLSKTFSGANGYVGEAWNDRISSMKVLCD